MHLQEIGLDPEAGLAAAGPAYDQHILLRAVLGSLGRLDIVRRSVWVRMMLSSNLGATYGSMSLALPQRAEPYSLPWRYFLAFLPFR